MIENFKTELLLRVTGMEPALADKHIARLKKWLSEEKAACKPYLWVDTGFKRKSQPLFALAACEK
jgi:hypothetical protein